MCEDRCDSLWPNDSFERFKTFLVPLRTVPLSATSNDFFFSGTRANSTSLAIFVTNPDSLGLTNRDSVTYPFKRSIGRIRQVLALIFLVSLLNPKYNKVSRGFSFNIYITYSTDIQIRTRFALCIVLLCFVRAQFTSTLLIASVTLEMQHDCFHVSEVTLNNMGTQTKYIYQELAILPHWNKAR